MGAKLPGGAGGPFYGKDYSLLAHFTIYQLDSTPVVQNVPQVLDILQGTGLKFQPGPLGTRVEGDWEEVMAAIRRCHGCLAVQHRVLTTILIHDEHLPNSFHKEPQSCKASS